MDKNDYWELRYFPALNSSILDTNFYEYARCYVNRRQIIKDMLAEEYPNIDFSHGFYIQPLEKEKDESNLYLFIK